MIIKLHPPPPPRIPACCVGKIGLRGHRADDVSWGCDQIKGHLFGGSDQVGDMVNAAGCPPPLPAWNFAN
jgi:hypothetical protein